RSLECRLKLWRLRRNALRVTYIYMKPASTCCKTLCENVVGTRPRYYVISAAQPRDIRNDLISGCGGVYLKLSADPMAASIKLLSINSNTGGVLQVRLPGNDKAASSQWADRRQALGVNRRGVHPKLISDGASRGVKHPGKYVLKAIWSICIPDHDKV